MKTDLTRYIIERVFALIVFGLGFYSLVLYEFALPELIQGAFISFMTLAAQFVFGEALGSAVGRRAQQSFETGLAAQPTVTTSPGPPPVTMVEPAATAPESHSEERG